MNSLHTEDTNTEEECQAEDLGLIEEEDCV